LILFDRDWRERTEGISIPEAELRNEFAENPGGTVGSYKIPRNVPAAIMEGDHRRDYSEIRVPLLAFVGYPELPQDQTLKKSFDGRGGPQDRGSGVRHLRWHDQRSDPCVG
jgi:hypothetical protein